MSDPKKRSPSRAVDRTAAPSDSREPGSKSPDDHDAEATTNDASPSAAAAAAAAAAAVTASVSAKRSHSERWDEQFQRLLEFKRIHGHCNVPFRYPEDPSLGRWVSQQRAIYKSEQEEGSSSGPSAARLAAPDYQQSLERLRRLRKVNFEWSPVDSKQRPWEWRFRELVQFIESHGHSRVPFRWEENPKLANWVAAQRKEYRRFQSGQPTRITLDQIRKLNSVHFCWNALKRPPSFGPGEDAAEWTSRQFVDPPAPPPVVAPTSLFAQSPHSEEATAHPIAPGLPLRFAQSSEPQPSPPGRPVGIERLLSNLHSQSSSSAPQQHVLPASLQFASSHRTTKESAAAAAMRPLSAWDAVAAPVAAARPGADGIPNPFGWRYSCQVSSGSSGRLPWLPPAPSGPADWDEDNGWDRWGGASGATSAVPPAQTFHVGDAPAETSSFAPNPPTASTAPFIAPLPWHPRPQDLSLAAALGWQPGHRSLADSSLSASVARGAASYAALQPPPADVDAGVGGSSDASCESWPEEGGGGNGEEDFAE